MIANMNLVFFSLYLDNASKKRNGQSHDNNSSSDESWTVAADA